MGVLCAAAANDGSEDNEKMINAKINSASVGREARRDRHMGCVLSGSGPCYGRANGEVKPECAEKLQSKRFHTSAQVWIVRNEETLIADVWELRVFEEMN